MRGRREFPAKKAAPRADANVMVIDTPGRRRSRGFDVPPAAAVAGTSSDTTPGDRELRVLAIGEPPNGPGGSRLT